MNTQRDQPVTPLPDAVARHAVPGRRVLLACSTGGHLAQLVRLRPWWDGLSRLWVTFDNEHSRSLLAGELVAWAYHPTTRNIPNLLRNTRLAWRVLRRFRPALIVSNGAGVAVPFFVLGKLLGIPTVYIEVVDRIESATMTGRICYPIADEFLVQWSEQRELYPRASVIGRLI